LVQRQSRNFKYGVQTFQPATWSIVIGASAQVSTTSWCLSKQRI
jgi:hypothetical protein